MDKKKPRRCQRWKRRWCQPPRPMCWNWMNSGRSSRARSIRSGCGWPSVGGPVRSSPLRSVIEVSGPVDGCGRQFLQPIGMPIAFTIFGRPTKRSCPTISILPLGRTAGKPIMSSVSITPYDNASRASSVRHSRSRNRCICTSQLSACSCIATIRNVLSF